MSNTQETSTDVIVAPLAKAVVGKRMSIPGDQVNAATVNEDDATRSAIRWLHTYACDRDLGLDELAALLKKPNGELYDKHTLYAVFTGRHGASKANIVKAILTFRELQEKR